MNGVDLGPIGRRHLVEAGHGPIERVGRDERAETRDRQRPPHPTVDDDAADAQWSVLLGGRRQFDRRQFRRLVLGQPQAGEMADERLAQRGDRRERERDQEAEAMVFVAATTQHPDGVDRGDDEADEHERADPHVRELEVRRLVEHRRQWPHVRHRAVRGKCEPGRCVHPGVYSDDAVGADDASGSHRQQRAQVGARRQTSPTVEVDAEEDGFDEEGDALDRERQAEDVAEATHQPRPQQAHLEAEHGARHGTDGEEHGGDLRPALGETKGDRVVVPDGATVHHVDHRREGDAKAGEDDVPTERQRHLLAGRRQPRRRPRCDRQHGQRYDM